MTALAEVVSIPCYYLNYVTTFKVSQEGIDTEIQDTLSMAGELVPIEIIGSDLLTCVE
jgi:hypothetical protein